MVSISYGHGHLNDCHTATDYTKTDDGNTSTFTIDSGDYFKLDVTVSAGNEETKVVNDVNISADPTLYTKIRWRYKTSNANIKAKIILEFNDATTQTVLADSSSTTWTVGTETITTGSDLDHIRLYADHATGTVYYDFCLMYEGDFTLPNGAFGINGVLPNRNLFLECPSRLTDITQMLGSGNFEFNIGCNFSIGTWTRVGDAINGQVFYDIVYNAKDESWQWLDTEREQLKVTLEPPRFRREASGDNLTDRMDLMFKEYRLSDAGNSLETYISRWGLDL